jgi:hypothetical protein
MGWAREAGAGDEMREDEEEDGEEEAVGRIRNQEDRKRGCRGEGGYRASKSQAP